MITSPFFRRKFESHIGAILADSTPAQAIDWSPVARRMGSNNTREIRISCPIPRSRSILTPDVSAPNDVRCFITCLGHHFIPFSRFLLSTETTQRPEFHIKTTFVTGPKSPEFDEPEFSVDRNDRRHTAACFIRLCRGSSDGWVNPQPNRKTLAL